MKKILAIMLIAVIAVAGVFAEYTVPGDTTVQLNYVVAGIFQPAYKLFYDTAAANSTITVYTNETKDIGIVAGESKTFTLKDTTKFNSTKASAMKLAVSVVDHWTGTDTYGTTSASASTLSIDSFSVIVASGADSSMVTQASDELNAVKMTYTANNSLDRSDTPADVATFKVKWTAAPIAEAQTYTADLTVAFTTI